MTDQAIHYQCLVAVHSTIAGLGLDGLAVDRVYKRKVLTDRNTVLQFVQVFFPPLAETDLGGTTGEDDFGYPVGVAVVDGDDADYELTEEQAKPVWWKQRIRGAFHAKRLQGVPVSFYCLWEPAPVIDMGLWQTANIWVSGGIIRCVTRERRP